MELSLILITGVLPMLGPNKALSPQEERTVRNAVYNEDARTASRDLRRILVVPNALADLYRKNSRSVVDLLLTIMDGASPKDSVLASAYAIALLQAPDVATVCLDNFDKLTYDIVDNDWKITPRKHWIKKVLILSNKDK